jgi:hypothetical protein
MPYDMVMMYGAFPVKPSAEPWDDPRPLPPYVPGDARPLDEPDRLDKLNSMDVLSERRRIIAIIKGHITDPIILAAIFEEIASGD